MEKSCELPRPYWGYGILLWIILATSVICDLLTRYNDCNYEILYFFHIDYDLVVFALHLCVFLLCSVGVVLNIVALAVRQRPICRYSGDMFLLSAIGFILPYYRQIFYYFLYLCRQI